MRIDLQADIGKKEWLTGFRQQLEEELQAILDWWMHHAKDEKRGGFYGSVNDANEPNVVAPKGLVLHARAVWTFAAAYRYTGKQQYLSEAEKAFHFLESAFLDKINSGFYWSVDAEGRMLDGKKQLYGQAFTIYGLSELYLAGGNQSAIDQAIRLYEHLEQVAWDKRYGGYIEAFEQDWTPRADFRLSEKEENLCKTMNTHLHMIEAYANLYKAWPNAGLATRIRDLLDIFSDKIINRTSNRQRLFFTETWQPAGSIISFGHDIEAAWLLHECAVILGDAVYTERFSQLAIAMAYAATDGLDADGGLWYEYEAATDHWIREKHWWPQAEAMVGFFNAWQLSGEDRFLQQAAGVWIFIQRYIRDQQNGEWYWGVTANLHKMEGQDKAGFWKCPYHNSRACIELGYRIGQMLVS
ncbi:MAG: AGE family epimerase/isomerase [Chitinophagaceae bacterium]|nr:AGE family epimerase/isomerase [Chitinophagaceae bacterium]